MKFDRTLLAHTLALVLAAWANAAYSTEPPALPLQAPVVPGERLSDWLLRIAGANADTSAMQWRVEAERAPQSRLRQAVLDALQTDASITLADADKAHLADWLRALPLTGRAILANSDARWLQGSPAQDPVLFDRHSVILFERPRTVTVLDAMAKPCLAPHVSGALVQDYLHACQLAGDRVDWAWVAQPDGRTKRFGVARWNTEAQDEPAPGAWIWAPSRAARLPNSLSDNLARFLATQAPLEFETTKPLVPAPLETVASGVTPDAIKLTASDWGEIGLLQTPTARMAPAGDMRLQMSHVAPYTRGTVMLQPLDWMEFGFRYTDVANRLFGPADYSGSQTYKDKSIDFKLRLHEETAHLPQVAVGLRDVGGTGLFSGEYLVASKRWGDWDASLGLGWGYMGGRGNIKNPLSVLGSSFSTRPAIVGRSGGEANTLAMFRGPTALFGGVQWHAPNNPWTVKLELDGNDYQHEPQTNNQVTKSPFNIGAVYTYSPNIDFSLGLERGKTWMMGLTLHSGINALHTPKVLDPALPPFKATAAARVPPAGWGQTAQNIEIYTGWSVRSISHERGQTTLQIEADGALYLQERLDRVIAVLHQDALASTTRFVIQLQQRGLPVSRIDVDRAEWVARHYQAQAPELRLPVSQADTGQEAPPAALADWRSSAPGFHAVLDPSYIHHLGGPDGFLLYQMSAQAKLEQRFSDNTWLTGVFNVRLLDNYDKYKHDGASTLPRVRADARQYVTTSVVTLPLLQATHVQALGGNQYLSVYGGMLEVMFGGVGAEWLYRPWRSPLAFGIDANHVRQRDFRQNLAFRDYSVNTGHATLYWDTGWNDVQAKLSAGRYLAGDTGVTLDVKRVFQNGTAIGAWATKTNVSSASQFGEDSFDKGIYVSIPFDVMMPKSSPGMANIVWMPVTRDAGARLSRRFTLFDLTSQRDSRALRWRDAVPGTSNSGEDTSYVLHEPADNIFQSLPSSGAELAGQVADLPLSTWLWAGGAVLASSLLDKQVDNWAINHQTPRWNTVGKIGNNLPVLMALGAGALYTGIGGSESASTAETALKAGAYTLGASVLTRYVVGRARPAQDLGNAHFDGFGSGASQSGFPSNHVALAFALVTPFAQKHDMPWLYGAAALTAAGRIQSRDHWLSDTVGGALMGYAIGTLMGNQQNNGKGVRYKVTPQSIEANWVFK